MVKVATSAIARAGKLLQEVRANMEEGESFEDFDPQALEAVGVVLGIMRGKIRGRHTATRLTAATTLLHQYRGKPGNKHEMEIGDNLAQLIEKSMKLEGRERPELPAPEEIEDAEIVEDENVSVPG